MVSTWLQLCWKRRKNPNPHHRFNYEPENSISYKTASAHSEDTVTLSMRRLIRIFAVHLKTLLILGCQKKKALRRLIRLRGSAGWSWSWLGAQCTLVGNASPRLISNLENTQRRINVAATSWRCSDVVTTLCVWWAFSLTICHLCPLNYSNSFYTGTSSF